MRAEAQKLSHICLGTWEEHIESLLLRPRGQVGRDVGMIGLGKRVQHVKFVLEVTLRLRTEFFEGLQCEKTITVLV